MTPHSPDPRSPVEVVESSTRWIVHDAMELAELQLQLFEADGRACARAVAPPLVVALVGVVIAVSSLPLLLVALAYALVTMAGFAIWLAMLCSALAGLGLGGGAAFLGARKIGPQLAIWKRSTGELKTNIEWLKATLRRPRPTEPGPLPGPHVLP